MPDYVANSKKSKEGVETPPKIVAKVITTEVVVPKKGIGSKFRGLFIEADFRTVTRYVVLDVLLPAARNMILDAVSKGTERMLYGESAVRRRNFGAGPRITYNNPVNRSYGGSPLQSQGMRFAPEIRSDPRTSTYQRSEFLLTTREEADLVVERMTDIIDNYDVVSVADLHDLVGLQSSHVDNKWGWTSLNNVQIRQVREGYLIDFPPAETIQ